MTLPDNKRVFNYYVRKLEEQVLQFRNVDPQKFRNGDDDGRPKPVFNKDWESMRLIMPDPDYSCGADFCDDPACVTHRKSTGV